MLNNRRPYIPCGIMRYLILIWKMVRKRRGLDLWEKYSERWWEECRKKDWKISSKSLKITVKTEMSTCSRLRVMTYYWTTFNINTFTLNFSAPILINKLWNQNTSKKLTWTRNSSDNSSCWRSKNNSQSWILIARIDSNSKSTLWLSFKKLMMLILFLNILLIGMTTNTFNRQIIHFVKTWWKTWMNYLINHRRKRLLKSPNPIL